MITLSNNRNHISGVNTRWTVCNVKNKVCVGTNIIRSDKQNKNPVYITTATTTHTNHPKNIYNRPIKKH